MSAGGLASGVGSAGADGTTAGTGAAASGVAAAWFSPPWAVSAACMMAAFRARCVASAFARATAVSYLVACVWAVVAAAAACQTLSWWSASAALSA